MTPLRAWPYETLDASRNRGWFHRLMIWLASRPGRDRFPW